VHKSFAEYFAARLILLAAGSDAPLDLRINRTVSALTMHGGRRIQDEPQVLYLLADHWQHVFGPNVTAVDRARETLFAVVAASARGVGVAGGAAANAATVLNWMGEPMLRQAWDGVVLEGADLTRAVLCGTSLAGARLGGARLENAVLRDVDMSRANVTGVVLGPYLLGLDHPAGVTSVAFGTSPVDGRLLIASGSDDRSVRVWDALSGRAVGEPLVGHTDDVSSVAFGTSPVDGRLLIASGSWDNSVRVWDALSGRALGEPLVGHTDDVSSVAFGTSPVDGTLLIASGSDDKSVRVWDALSGRAVGEPLVGHTGGVSSVAFRTSPQDGRRSAADRQWQLGQERSSVGCAVPSIIVVQSKHPARD
jgi:hypothetical protein